LGNQGLKKHSLFEEFVPNTGVVTSPVQFIWERPRPLTNTNTPWSVFLLWECDPTSTDELAIDYVVLIQAECAAWYNIQSIVTTVVIGTSTQLMIWIRFHSMFIEFIVLCLMTFVLQSLSFL